MYSRKITSKHVKNQSYDLTQPRKSKFENNLDKFPEIRNQSKVNTVIYSSGDPILNKLRENNKNSTNSDESTTENSPYKKREKRTTLPNLNNFNTSNKLINPKQSDSNNNISTYNNHNNSKYGNSNNILGVSFDSHSKQTTSRVPTSNKQPNNKEYNISPIINLKNDYTPLIKSKDGMFKLSNMPSYDMKHDEHNDKPKFKTKTAYKTKAGNNGGQTKTNQDSYLMKLSGLKIEGFNLFSVMDGHGSHGHFISNSVKAMFSEYIFRIQNFDSHPTLQSIKKKVQDNDYNLLKKCFQYCETTLAKSKYEVNFSGTTAVMVVQIDDILICANTGDSRAILYTGDKIINLSLDHKPENEGERERINSSGGRVEKFNDNGNFVGPYRVWLKNEDYPGLAMSRSLGDFVSKSVGCSCIPEIIEQKVDSSCQFMIIASDGVWEFLDNQAVCKLVEPYYLKNDPDGACSRLIEESARMWKIEDDGQDDITCVIVFFHPAN